MKKLFTMVVAFLAAMTLSAETTLTVWEGSESASWGNRIAFTPDWSSVLEGDVLTFTAEIVTNPDGNYAAFHLLDGSWQKVVSDLSFPYEVGTTQTTTYTLTQADIDAALTQGGLGVQGVGFTLKKVQLTTNGTPDPEPEDVEAALLWAGTQEIAGWGAQSLVLEGESLPPFVNSYADVTTATNMYVLVEGVGNMRIAGQWGDWAVTEYPSADYNHMGNKDTDNVVRIKLTPEFIANAFGGETPAGFAFWGDSYIIKAIGTTKESVLPKTTLLNTISNNSGIRYNMMGQVVDEDYKGVVIMNGNKMVIR